MIDLLKLRLRCKEEDISTCENCKRIILCKYIRIKYDTTLPNLWSDEDIKNLNKHIKFAKNAILKNKKKGGGLKC